MPPRTPTIGPMDLEAFWTACERRSLGESADIKPALEPLSRAHDHELAGAVEQGRAALAEARALTAPFTRVHRVLGARLSARTGDASELVAARTELEELLSALPEQESSTRGRILHTLAVIALREHRLAPAETLFAAALRTVTTEPVVTWILDGFAQVLVNTGAWEEARRLYAALMGRRRVLGDVLGVAITAGSLGRMLVSLHRPAEGASVAAEAIAETAGKIPDTTLLRLATLHLDACLDLGPGVPESAARLESLVSGMGDRTHYLVGYALLSLARAASKERASDLFARADHHFTLGPMRAWARYSAARVLPERVVEDASDDEPVTEAVVFGRLLLAERAHAEGDVARRRQALERAYFAVRRASHPVWRESVDRVARILDPDLFMDETARRFTARSMDELSRPTSDVCTIVFCDIVKFTSLSQVLSPDDLIAASRGFFELAVPLLAQHRVRPLAYLGDALLAVAEGEDHHGRGIAFARALVGRVIRVRDARAAAGLTVPTGLDGAPLPFRIRGGVATGPVVMGVLGNGFKQEFTAIGRTCNLAARLQALAEPDEVVAEATVEEPTERVTLKGFDAQQIPIVRVAGDR